EINVQMEPGAASGAQGSFTGSVQRIGSTILRSFRQLTILATDRGTVTVDRGRALILYSARGGADRTVQMAIGPESLAKLQPLAGAKDTRTITQIDQDTWSIEGPGSKPGQRIQVVFNPRSQMLKRVTIDSVDSTGAADRKS